MNELRRTAYLQAMGTDAYISRTQLPGAALTRRLVILREQSQNSTSESADANPQSPVTGLSPAAEGLPIPRIEVAGSMAERSQAARADTRAPAPAMDSVPRFSLVAIMAGGWLWLEELGGGALAREQLQLVQAMAHALATINSPDDGPASGQPQPGAAKPHSARPEVSQFTWPIHTNQQLDLGIEAARSGVAGFIRRKLEQHQCRGLVLLGQPCAEKVPLDQLDCGPVLRTLSSAAMLVDSQLKKQAWRDLRQSYRRR